MRQGQPEERESSQDGYGPLLRAGVKREKRKEKIQGERERERDMVT